LNILYFPHVRKTCKIPPYFYSFWLPLLRPWCIYTSCVTRPGHLWPSASPKWIRSCYKSIEIGLRPKSMESHRSQNPKLQNFLFATFLIQSMFIVSLFEIEGQSVLSVHNDVTPKMAVLDSPTHSVRLGQVFLDPPTNPLTVTSFIVHEIGMGVPMTTPQKTFI